MKILIVDDEPLARSRLRALIEELGEGEIVGEASSGQQAVSLCENCCPDVVLMDIRMPGMDGIEAAGHLGNLADPPSIIFTTAFDEYALRAFDVHAIDYLVKPVRKERLLDALARVKHLTNIQSAALEEVSDRPPQHISVRIQGGLRLIDVDDIYYFLAEDKYVVVRHVDGEVLLEEPLKALEERFADRFIRIHRNALVSARQLLALERDENGHFKAVFRDIDSRLDVSRRHLPLVRDFLKKSE